MFRVVFFWKTSTSSVKYIAHNTDRLNPDPNSFKKTTSKKKTKGYFHNTKVKSLYVHVKENQRPPLVVPKVLYVSLQRVDIRVMVFEIVSPFVFTFKSLGVQSG